MTHRNLDFRRFLRRVSSRTLNISRKNARAQRPLSKDASVRYANDED